MFNSFLTALAQKITSYLVKHPDLFNLKDAERSKKLENLSIPKPFKTYLEKVSEKDFMDDLSVLVNYIKSPKTAELKKNALFIALLEFLTEDLARKTDYLSGDFYLLSKEKRQATVDELIKADSLLAETLKGILTNNTYQQLANEIQELGKKVIGASHILIQSPREIETELKREIRNKLNKENPLSFPTFQINRKLIGGIRVFQDGQVIDHSWISRVLRFTSLTAN